MRCWTLCIVAGVVSCSSGAPKVAEGIFSDLGEIYPAASAEQKVIFERGREVARRHFSVADGLGPKFNVSSCAACHEKPLVGGSAARYRNFLLVGQELPDGSFTPTGTSGVQGQYTFTAEGRVPLDLTTNVIATRNPIPFFGVGLLAEIPDTEILALADVDDADGDGISGRPNYDRGFVGRFGRKSQTVSIEGFIRGPLFNHLGLTSEPLSGELRAALPVPSPVLEPAPGLITGAGPIRSAQASAPEAPNFDSDAVPDPELSAFDLFDLVSFAMLLGAPAPEPLSDATKRGRELFMELNCTGCHVPALNGPRGLIPAYSDLLLHDMGPVLADGIVMEEASGAEFRTQPLWGVAAVGPYLHDGRADTLDQAIRLHGGEASRAREGYELLSTEEQSLLIQFLGSLGGREAANAGLLLPGEPLLPEGAYGGPREGLDDAERAQFAAGRAVFDLDFSLGDGVGPLMNGDSCRACHFAPVIGGGGPEGVNVIRHGIVNGTEFSEPSIGTMAHKFTTAVDTRAPIDTTANVFEHRQTPPVFGLGLIEQIPDATLLTRDDPMDLDMDGVSGRVHILPDARIGRFGWKADVPSLAEFARDGMANELGITVPSQPGLTFGNRVDSDAAIDPEITLTQLEDLVFYMRNLAVPPRIRSNSSMEDAGELVFTAIGCDGCHTSSMNTAEGTPVPLYSDLLLHDVAPPVFVGIAAGDATMREFRTPPLWGLSQSAPYMHDGRSPSIEDAILRHDSEAAGSRQAFTELVTDARNSLMAFLRSL